MMINDRGEHVKEAFAGEAVHMSGFKAFPEVGSPLYVVSTPEEAKFIVTRVRQRNLIEENKKKAKLEE